VWIAITYLICIIVPSYLFCDKIIEFSVLRALMLLVFPLYHLFFFVVNVVYSERKGIIIDYYEIYENWSVLKSIRDKNLFWVVSLVFGGFLSYILLGMTYIVLFVLYSMGNIKMEKFLFLKKRRKSNSVC